MRACEDYDGVNRRRGRLFLGMLIIGRPLRCVFRRLAFRAHSCGRAQVIRKAMSGKLGRLVVPLKEPLGTMIVSQALGEMWGWGSP